MGAELTQRELENIVAEHAGLVRSVALRLSHIYQAEAEDLMQIGYIGLMKAARRFEAGRGFAFSTYAVPMITGEIRSQMRDQGRIKVSRSLKADIAAVRRAENQFAAQYGGSPRITELQKLTGFSAERITQALAAADTMNHPEVYEEQQLFCDEEMQHITHIDLAGAAAAGHPAALLQGSHTAASRADPENFTGTGQPHREKSPAGARAGYGR